MELQNLCIKLFAEDSSTVEILDFVPLFHRWIKEQSVAEHLLIDVADYSHVWNGPGIILVAHQANFNMDQETGRLGLLYQRKQPVEGDLPQRLRFLINTTLHICERLQSAPELDGKLRFGGQEMLIQSNDRMRAPHSEESHKILESALADSLQTLYGNSSFTVARGNDTKSRPTLTVLGKQAVDIQTLLDRTGS